jgi:putative transposase
VSRICAGLDEIVGAFRTRRLEHIEFPDVYLDATYLHVRNTASQVTSRAVVIATGITATGERAVLGVDVGDREDEVFWRGFVRSLKTRGLHGVRPVISDEHAGLVAALRRSFQGASHQRCRVHFARNLLALVPMSHQDMVAAVFRTIFAHPDSDTVSSTWDQIRDHLVTASPRSPCCWTTPRPRSTPGAVLADTHDEWQARDRRYLSQGSMTKLYPERDTHEVAELTPATDTEDHLEDHHARGHCPATSAQRDRRGAASW